LSGEVLGKARVRLDGAHPGTKVQEAPCDTASPGADLEDIRPTTDATSGLEQLVHPLRILRPPGVVVLRIIPVEMPRLAS
jgi:hypothetical protein